MGCSRRDSRRPPVRPSAGVAVAVLAVLVVACARRVPAIVPLGPGATILAFGDSLTFGTGADPSESYPAVLQELSGHPVVNAGVPGEVSEEGLRRLPGVLDEHKPALLILCHGGNDLLRHEAEDRLEENLERMADVAVSRGIPVVLIGVPRAGLFMRTAPVYEAVAKKKRLPLENEVLTAIESTPALKSDQIHPNREGYRKMAQAVLRVLRTSGAL